MAEPTIVLRSPVKSVTSSLRSSSPNPTTLNSPTHNSTVIILKDNNNNEHQSQQPQSTSTVKNSNYNQSLFLP